MQPVESGQFSAITLDITSICITTNGHIAIAATAKRKSGQYTPVNNIALSRKDAEILANAITEGYRIYDRDNPSNN